MGTSAFERLWGEEPPRKRAVLPLTPAPAQTAQEPQDDFDALWDAPTPTAEPTPRGVKGTVRDVLAAAYQGATFGLGNKLTAATRAVLPEWMGGTDGFDYSGALASERENLEQFRARHPYAAAASEGVGGVLPALATAGTGPVAQAFPVLNQALRPSFANAARTGAAYGGMYGAGEGDNPSIGELAGNATAGAAIGATLAGAIHGGTRLPTWVMDYTGMRPSAHDNGPVARMARRMGVQTPEERAPSFIVDRLERGGVAPADVTGAFRQAERLGNKPATLIEAGGLPMQRLARGTQGVRSRGADDIRTALQGRREGAPVRVASDVESGLGQIRQDTYEANQKLIGQQLAKAKPLYDEAMKSGAVPLTAAVPLEDGTSLSLADLLKRPSAQKAIGYGQRLAAEQGKAFPDLGAKATTTELPEVVKSMTPEAQAKFMAEAAAQGAEVGPATTHVDFQHLHNLKLRLDELIGYGKANGKLPDGTPATKQELRAIQETKNKLLEIMDGHSPVYRDARRVWGGEAELQEGLALGQDFLNSKRPLGELKAEMAQMSDAAQEQVRLGVVSAVRDKIDNAMDGADVVRRIFGNEAQRNRLRLAFRNDVWFNRFRQQMELESQMAKNENFVLGGSPTTEKLSDVADVTDGINPAHILSSGAKGVALKALDAARLKNLAVQRTDALAPYLTAGTPASRMSRDDVMRMLAEEYARRQPRIRASRAATAVVSGQAGSGTQRP